MASIMNMEEAFPSRFQPKPFSVSQLESLKGAYDPMLIATPERRLPTVAQLQHPAAFVSQFPDDDSFCGRVTRVHFDQNVAVHHISPESINSSGSVVECCPSSSSRAKDKGMRCPELDLTNLSDSEPISVVASDLRNVSPAMTSSFKTNSGINSKNVSNVASFNDRQHKRKSADKLPRKSSSSHGIGLNTNHDNIRQQETDSVDEYTLKRSHSGRKSPSESSSRTSVVSPIVVSETGSTEGLCLSDAVRLTIPSIEAGSQCVLARPELNSTLRLSREIEHFKDQEFDVSAVLKEKMNPKVKTKIVEKAYSKLNAETNMYPDLIGIEVSESDLLSRVAEEKSNRVKTSEVTEKAEDKISRIPDVMDFFTADLHKESPSVSVIAVAPLRLEPHTAQLNRAFDLYRHIRTWEKL